MNGPRAELRRRLAQLADVLLGEEPAPLDQRAAANALYAFLDALAGHPQDAVGSIATPWQTETLLATGKAINPYSAATCLLDYARTRAFGRGLHAAIRDAQGRFPGERIAVLYAGTGPFAPLALLQIPAFSPAELGVTLIDAHRPALDCVARLVAKLGVEDYVEQSVHADAAVWTPPGGKRYHVLVAEVMQRALTVEPQVAVTLNLVRHLRDGGVLVPERIELSLCMLDPGAEFQLSEAAAEPLADYLNKGGFFPLVPTPVGREDAGPGAGQRSAECRPLPGRTRVVIAKPFTLTRASAAAAIVAEDGRIRLPNVGVPEVVRPGLVPRILTTITTFPGITLGDYESGLTFPHPLADEFAFEPGLALAAWYETRRPPGLRLRPLPALVVRC